MKKLFTLLLFLLPFAAFADKVSEQRAKDLAIQFLKSSPGSRSTTISLQMVFNGIDSESRSSTDSPAFYVFNNTSGPGFVIVSGEDAVLPVFGYSTDFNFASNPVPYNVKGWLEELSKQVNYVRQSNLQPSAAIQTAWNKVPTRGAASRSVKHETALWNQDDPFNRECPLIGGERAVTGCVATAMSIVMHAHQWPDHGVGSIPGYAQVPSRTLGESYNWSDMPYQYTPSTSEGAKKQVARLMADCGAMVRADYGAANVGTSAFLSDVPKAIVEYMKYSTNIRYKQRKFYSTSDWHKLIQDELNQHGPLIYGGQGTGGHAFVLDGYNADDTYSVNWGWGGFCNGYYSLDVMNPDNDNYSYEQEAVVGIQRTSGEVAVEEMSFVVSGDVSRSSGISVIPTSPKKGENFTIILNGIQNTGLLDLHAVVMSVAHTDRDGHIKMNLININCGDVEVGGYFPLMELTARIGADIMEGDRIRLFFKSSNTSSWKLIQSINPTEVPWEVVLEGTEEEISIGKEVSFAFDKTTKVLTLGLKAGVSVKLTSPSGNNMSHLCNIYGNECKVETEELVPGKYTFTFTKAGKSVDLKVSIGEK